MDKVFDGKVLIKKRVMLQPIGKWFGIVLVGIKNPINYGSIMRLAVNYDAKAVWLVGRRFKRFPADTYHVARHLPVIEVDSLDDINLPEVEKVWVEYSPHSVKLMNFQHPKRALYIFGAEDGSLLPPIYSYSVYIPTFGSLNLAVSVGTLLYDRMLKEALKCR